MDFSTNLENDFTISYLSEKITPKRTFCNSELCL